MNNISIVTCSMNREGHLNKTIPNLNKLLNINEHIIIDWSSENLLQKNLQTNSKIKIYRVENEYIWWHNRAYNLAFYIADSEYILKIDADVLLDYEKFNKLNYENYDLVIFHYSSNDPGNYLIKKDLIKKINGLNEYMWQWGWQDHDIINRALKHSDKVKYLDLKDYISKIEHKNETRNLVNVKNIFKNKELFFYAYMKATNDTNVFIAKNNTWKNNDLLSYTIKDNIASINHLYDLKSLNFFFKIRYKYKLINSFFKIYKQQSKYLKRIIPIVLIFLPKNYLRKIFSIQLYPNQ